MFTGIIEEVGHVKDIEVTGGKRRVIIACEKILEQLKLGDSVSVSGVCLTAVDITNQFFSADLAGETWARTSLSRLHSGAIVNLELPLRASGRLDGHIVQGHVDGTGTLVSLAKVRGANDYLLTFNVPSELTRYIVAKGSLAVEGISLTVAGIECVTVTMAIIPHTAEVTNLNSLSPGDPLNLEVDVIAKYVEKMMAGRIAQASITVEKLVREGF
jgi:riboflavin synthase